MHQAALFPAVVSGINFCRRCGRPLSHPRSREAGMGPVCRGYHRGHAMQSAETTATILSDPPYDPETRDVVCRRIDGHLRCNIPHRHVEHSPTGFECGYGGSGPADLALNVLALHLPIEDPESAITLHDGSQVSAVAFDLHQDFKWRVIATMSPEGGVISGAEVSAWLVDRLRSYWRSEEL